jgi:hypothetical protein
MQQRRWGALSAPQNGRREELISVQTFNKDWKGRRADSELVISCCLK